MFCHSCKLIQTMVTESQKMLLKYASSIAPPLFCWPDMGPHCIYSKQSKFCWILLKFIYVHSRVRTDSSSGSDRRPVWSNLQQTESAGVDRPGLTVTRLVAYKSIFYLHYVKVYPNVDHIHYQHLVNYVIYRVFAHKMPCFVCKQTLCHTAVSIGQIPLFKHTSNAGTLRNVTSRNVTSREANTDTHQTVCFFFI